MLAAGMATTSEALLSVTPAASDKPVAEPAMYPFSPSTFSLNRRLLPGAALIQEETLMKAAKFHVYLILLTGSLLPHTDAIAAKAKDTASSIEYQLPVTALQIKLDLVLQDCFPTPKARATFTAAPLARPSPHPEHYFKISGADLAAFRLKRELKIDLHPNGSIKSINGGVADRTGAIIGNLLKLASVVGALNVPVGVNGTSLGCNVNTSRSLNAFKATKKNIEELQKKLTGGNAQAAAEVRKDIDALAVELARIQTSSLSLSLTRIIEFWPNQEGGIVEWNSAELAKWFDVPNTSAQVAHFSLAYCVETLRVSGEVNDCKVGDAYTHAKAKPEKRPAPIDCVDGEKRCPTTIVFREPAMAVLSIETARQDLAFGGQPMQAVFPMAQWGRVTYFPLTTGLGGSKSFSLGLDEFGRRQSFSWSSGARGEEVTGALVGVAEAYSTYETARASEDFKALKAEADELELQKKLNELRRCKAILDAGGFVCPEE